MLGITDSIISIYGKTLTLRRDNRTSAPTDVVVRGTIRHFQPVELQGGLIQGDRKVVLVASDIVAASWPLPIRKNDLIVDGTSSYVVQAVNPVECAGVVERYDLVVRG